MKTLLAFTKKELLGQLRTGRVLILSLLFAFFGLMNPAVAKLTPWILEVMSEALAEAGMDVTDTTVSAMDSWIQFFKNLPMALIAFVLLEGNIFTREYQRGTLVLSLTKGLARYKVVVSKAAVLTLVWTVGYWLCFGITYGCNRLLWEKDAAQNLMLAVLYWWLFGLWVVSLMSLLSTIFHSFTGVLLGTGGIAIAAYVLGLIPKIGKYSPAYLTNGVALSYGAVEVKSFTAALVITILLSCLAFVGSVPLFNKKDL